MAAIDPPPVEAKRTTESHASSRRDKSRSRSRSPLEQGNNGDEDDEKKNEKLDTAQLGNKMTSCTKTRIPSESDEKLRVKKSSGHFLVPSPVPCRRTRTISTSKLAANSPVQRGTITEFCRGRGHGFVKPDDEDAKIFLHISDIEDEYVVQAGDRIEFRTIPMPPKMEQRMAVEAHLIDVDETAPHERWDSKPDLRIDK